MARLTLLLLLCVLPSIALAQFPSGMPEPGDLWVTFDETGSSICATPPPFTTDNVFWVVTYDLEIAGYEFGVNIDPNIVVLASGDVTNAVGSINVGQAPSNWIVGTGLCIGDPEVVQLVQFTYGIFLSSVADLLICLAPSNPASLNPPAPAYLTCDGNIFPFGILVSGGGVYPNGCGVLYPTNGTGGTYQCPQVIAVESTSWGTLKANY